MKLLKSFLAMTLALIPGITSINAFAEETIVYKDDDVTVVRVNDLSTYANDEYGSVWLNSSASGSFSVNTSHSGTVGITLKVQSTSNDSWAYISVQKPDGNYFKNNIYVDPTTGNGDGAVYKMYFASSGTYTIHYAAYTSVGMRIMCWLY